MPGQRMRPGTLVTNLAGELVTSPLRFCLVSLAVSEMRYPAGRVRSYAPELGGNTLWWISHVFGPPKIPELHLRSRRPKAHLAVCHLSLLASEGIEPLFRLKKSVLNLERPKALFR